MSDPVTHPAHAAPGSLSVLSREFWKPVHYFGCRLANDDQAHDDRLLRPFIVYELFLAQTFDEDQCVARGLTNVLAQGNRRADSRSYGTGLIKNLLTKFLRKVSRR